MTETRLNEFRVLGRELHRASFLTWRIPVAHWHAWRAERHRLLAQYHRDRVLTVSRAALDLAAQFPTIKEHA